MIVSKKYALIGNPIEHSLSPQIHQEFAKQAHCQLTYEKICTSPDQFHTILQQLIDNHYHGCNITAPFKFIAFTVAHGHGAAAQQSKTANTLVFQKNNTIYADSTDGNGFITDLTKNHQYLPKQKKILILGAGASAACILPELLAQQPSSIVIANRTEQKAKNLCQRYVHTAKCLYSISLPQLCANPQAFDLIINTTSAGYQHQQPIVLPPDLITPQTYCYDINYGQASHCFTQWAKNNNACYVAQGIGMLVEQAARSFFLWEDIYPNTQAVINLIMSKLKL